MSQLRGPLHIKRCSYERMSHFLCLLTLTEPLAVPLLTIPPPSSSVLRRCSLLVAIFMFAPSAMLSSLCTL
ncbi:hypothetical protein DL96DRAFT_289703 [Flagelloscypha sp. PMI_526]|nr:hypothetical protein DL96DRAFT_289703 [Flagelloscypha sp. PMI_526]